MNRPYHVPVLAGEVVRWLDPQPGHIVVDATAGGGGHSLLLGQKIAPDGVLVAIDQDPAALVATQAKLHDLSPTIIPIQGNFRRIAELLDTHAIPGANGILLDLGVSSHQLDAGYRGFSFRQDAPLDMRMDPSGDVSARHLLAQADESEISRILLEWGEERWAVRIARFIVEAREKRPIETTGDLVEVVKAAVPRKAWPRDIHPATRTFQALRIAVNDELGALEEGLEGAISKLLPAGRLAVIAYHSLEDRIVKRTFLRLSGRCQCPPDRPACECGARREVEVVTRKPVTPGDEEIRENPRSRSAKMRVAERVGAP